MTMGKNRLEAFSDGVLAIIITIMVLEMKAPHGESFADLLPVMPVFLSYILSFVYVGIYWNNHHHLLHTVHRVSGRILWANLHLLFWLSLFPFTTGWMGENHFAPVPTVVYGVVLLMAALAYQFLQCSIIASEKAQATGLSILEQALGNDRKGKVSVLFYGIALVAAFWMAWAAQVLYVIVALIWLIPDRRIEHSIEQQDIQKGKS